MTQKDIDEKNASFWDELCGTSLAKSLGINELSAKNLLRFDKKYLSYYPYLYKYVLNENLKHKKVLEIGLGFGTLGSLLVSQECDYWGIDIARNPVELMLYRLSLMGINSVDQIITGSALEIPFENESFDFVFSIGCLHHTGNLTRAVGEVERVLKKKGKAIIMLYNRNSLRMLNARFIFWLKGLAAIKNKNKNEEMDENIRGLYDKNTKNEVAPHTDFTSKSEIKKIFKNFSMIKIEKQNFDPLIFLNRKIIIPREKMLNNIARIFGLDLYITATK